MIEVRYIDKNMNLLTTVTKQKDLQVLAIRDAEAFMPSGTEWIEFYENGVLKAYINRSYYGNEDNN